MKQIPQPYIQEGKTRPHSFIPQNIRKEIVLIFLSPIYFFFHGLLHRGSMQSAIWPSQQNPPLDSIQSYVQESWENLIGLVLVESTTTGQETCLWCFVLTSFPITFPRDRKTNSSVSGTLPLPFSETDRLAPAPYRGILSPSRITVNTRWLFLGW